MGRGRTRTGRLEWPEPAELHPQVCPKCGAKVYSLTDHNVQAHPDPQQSLLNEYKEAAS
jgi:hypothetical protein